MRFPLGWFLRINWDLFRFQKEVISFTPELDLEALLGAEGIDNAG